MRRQGDSKDIAATIEVLIQRGTHGALHERVVTNPGDPTKRTKGVFVQFINLGAREELKVLTHAYFANFSSTSR